MPIDERTLQLVDQTVMRARGLTWSESLQSYTFGEVGMPEEPQACRRCGTTESVALRNVYNGFRRSDNLLFCDRCFSMLPVCHNCGITMTRRASWIGDGDRYCNQCFDELGYHTCVECDSTYHEEDCSYCPECGDEEEYHRPTDRLLPYDEVLDLNFLKHDPMNANQFYGCEVEMEAREDSWPTCYEELGVTGNLHLLKSDGSLSSYGTEMVLQPMTYEYIVNSDNLANLLRQARRVGYKADKQRTCGMHVHVNREAFVSQDSILKFSHYITCEAARAVSERQSRYWEGLGSYCKESKKLKWGVHYLMGDDRYVACNTSNGRTVEVRIFQSTITPWKYYKNVEFVRAALMLSNRDPAFPSDFSEDIVNYTVNNGAYINLNRFYGESLV